MTPADNLDEVAIAWLAVGTVATILTAVSILAAPVSVHSAEVEQPLCVTRRPGLAFDSSDLQSSVPLNDKMHSMHCAAMQMNTPGQLYTQIAAGLQYDSFAAEERWADRKGIEGHRVRIACVHPCDTDRKSGRIWFAQRRMRSLPETHVDNHGHIGRTAAEPTWLQHTSSRPLLSLVLH